MRHHRIEALLHLLRRNVLELGLDHPHMTERIFDLAGAIAIELVLDRPLERRAGRNRARDDRIGVGDAQAHRHRRAAERLRANDAHFGKLVRQHHAGVAEFELGVADAIAHRQAVALLGAECRIIEIDRRLRAADAEVGHGVAVPLGRLVFDLGHALVSRAEPDELTRRRRRPPGPLESRSSPRASLP